MGTEEVPKGSGFDQVGHMIGSGSAATRERRVELAGKHPELTLHLKQVKHNSLFIKHASTVVLAHTTFCSCAL